MRATISLPPPGASGTIIRTGLEGYFEVSVPLVGCASAGTAIAASTHTTKQRPVTSMRNIEDPRLIFGESSSRFAAAPRCYRNLPAGDCRFVTELSAR